MWRSDPCAALHQVAEHAETNDEPLAWLPATQGAVALRLFSLDAATRYSTDTPPWRDSQAAYASVQVPALSLDRSKVHVVSGLRLTPGPKVMPVLPTSILPPEALDLELDVEWLERAEDESHLRHAVPRGPPPTPAPVLHP